MRAHFVTTDVFTARKFGGNQLAVFPQAGPIPPELFQSIAREFNYSETTFVLPPFAPGHAARVRIFTPQSELPFAGHPTIGTAFVLATLGLLDLQDGENLILIEETAGTVPVMIRNHDSQPTFVQLTAPQLPMVVGAPPAISVLAELLSLTPDDLSGSGISPAVVSGGTPFLLVPLKDRAAVIKAKLDKVLYDTLLSSYLSDKIFIFAIEGDGHDELYARMFAPAIGIEEDPATGSAAVAVAGYLAQRRSLTDGRLKWLIRQGAETGRPSLMFAEAEKVEDQVTAVRVGGASVVMLEGDLILDD